MQLLKLVDDLFVKLFNKPQTLSVEVSTKPFSLNEALKWTPK